jgi:predicted RNA-binding Zn ribbon-like protein
MGKERPAPGDLEHVRSFVNTRDIEERTDELMTPRDLHEWMVSRGLLAPDEAAGEADLRRALKLREGLRTLLLANNGAPVNSAAADILDAAARHARLGARFRQDGSAALEPAAHGVDAGIGRLLAIVYTAMADGNWLRLKACRNPDCHWIFYDATKNRSGAWCEMGLCGNRAKARSYRERHRPDMVREA